MKSIKNGPLIKVLISGQFLVLIKVLRFKTERLKSKLEDFLFRGFTRAA